MYLGFFRNPVARPCSIVQTGEKSKPLAIVMTGTTILDCEKWHLRSCIGETGLVVFEFIALLRAGSLQTSSPVKPHLRELSECKRRVLCLDMDDTLIQMCVGNTPIDFARQQPDMYVNSRDGPAERGAVFIRPYLRTFLEVVSRVYEVVLFTAACKDYADQILDFIDPENRLFHHRIYRDSCVECIPDPHHPEAKVYIKDLRVLGRDLKDVILIDNSLQCFGYQLDAGILCNPYRGDPMDNELISILDVLSFVNKYPETDLQKVFRKLYNVSNLVDEFKSLGGIEGVRNMGSRKPVNVSKTSESATEEERFPYPPSVSRVASKQRQASIQRELAEDGSKARCPNTVLYESPRKRRPSLVPSSRFQASLAKQ